VTFKFEITDAAEVFRDPIGHYHHWTCLIGRLAEGTMRVDAPICVPAVDGSRMCARVLWFEAYGRRFGAEVSSGQESDPFGVFVSLPAPSPREIAMATACDSTPEEYHDLVLWALRHRPARLLHDRGPEGVGLPCHECAQVLYGESPVLRGDFEPALRNLSRHPDPYVARRAQAILSRSTTAQE
jgi:hypothetical protein